MLKKTTSNKKERCQKIDMALAVKISNQIKLQDVRLLGSECQQLCTIPQGDKIVDIDRKVRVETDKHKNIVLVFATFLLKAYSKREKAEKGEPFLNIQAVFVLVYQAKDLSNLSEEAFESFGNTNGVYNAWPYWREYVQNITCRMGLPALTIPVFRIVPASKQNSKKEKR